MNKWTYDDIFKNIGEIKVEKKSGKKWAKKEVDGGYWAGYEGIRSK